MDMKSYLLFVPQQAAPGDEGALEQAIVVKDAFSWLAFLTPVLWFLYFRHWLAAFGALTVFFGALALAQFFPVQPGTVLPLLLVFRYFIGLEASAIRGWSLRRRGFSLADVMVARDQVEAETALFRRWLTAEASREVVATTVAKAAPPAHTAGIVGLFPEPEGGR